MNEPKLWQIIVAIVILTLGLTLDILQTISLIKFLWSH
jgi:hypothetical protein